MRKKIIALLEARDQTWNQVDLNQLGDGGIVREQLMVKTGAKTDAYIFINGNFIGGYEELMKLFTSGIFNDVISGKMTGLEKFDYDVIVIGGGTAGLSTAFSCSAYKQSVCVVDSVQPTPYHGVSWGMGGTCVNVGCVPKKLMHRAAVLRNYLQDAPSFGWSLDSDTTQHNWEALIDKVQQCIKSVSWDIRKNLVKSGIHYINGFAWPIDKTHVKIKCSDDSEKLFRAKNIILAVGGRPRYLDIPGIEYCITSDEIFSLPEPPGKTLVIGASYVGLELASFLNSFNFEVTVMVRSTILNSIMFDQEIVNELEKEMKREGVQFVHNCTVVQVVKNSMGGGYQVMGLLDEVTPYSDQYDTVVLAVGRVSSTEGLNLEEVGIKTSSNNKILVNEREQTTMSTIYAVGDCANGRPELASTAIVVGRLLAKRINSINCKCTVDYRCIPTAIFTEPEYACCGPSEETAIQLYGKDRIKVYTSTSTPVEDLATNYNIGSTAKLITVLDIADVERLAGIHLVGPNASEIIQGFAFAVRAGVSKKDLDNFITIHPTCAEVLANFTLKGEASMKSC